MKIEVLCALLFTIIVVLLIYTNDDKIHIIDMRKNESYADENFNADYEGTVNMSKLDPNKRIVINGSQSDYVMADILTPGGGSDFTEYDSCEDYTKINAHNLAPNDMLRASTSRTYSKFIVYDDYSLSPSEASAVTGLDIRRGKRTSQNKTSIRSFEHDSKAL